ncbi:unnamed protein product [Symbiodinium sp. CCMP2456]|nr:unnamed protein product [Symbiodinium sp. CCMP2456]
MSRMEPPLDPATLAADVGGSEAQVDFLLEKYSRAAERNRCLRRKREDYRRWLQGLSSHQVPQDKAPRTSAQRQSKPHRSARALKRTCLAKGSMATCTDVPSVYLGRGGRSRKLARKPSVSPLLSLQQDVSLDQTRCPLEAWMNIVDASAGMDTDEASASPSEPPEAGSIEKPMQTLKEALQQSSTKAVVAVLPVLLAIELLLTRDSGYSAVFLESEGVQCCLECLRRWIEDAAIAKAVCAILANVVAREVSLHTSCSCSVGTFIDSTGNSSVWTEEGKAEESLVQWAEVPYPEGTTEYIFCFSKENTAICRAKLYCSWHNRRCLILALKVYVKLGTTDWLKMYSRLYHGCDLHPCENVPTPAMLTVAALVNTEEDLIDPDAEREIIMPSDRERHEAEVAHHRQQAIEAAKEMRSKLSVGGSPDATTIRSQPTILSTDFELYAKNGATHFPLQNEMMSKGWGQFVRFSPTISTVVNFSETQKVFSNLIDNLEKMPQEQRSMVTIHIHLCLQAIVHENLAVPLHESSLQAQENMERILKDVYIKHFDKILSLVPRPPIVMINHDRRFLAASHRVLDQRQNFAGYDAVGAYLSLQLRFRGCIVVHGSSFWCKIMSSLKESQSGSHLFSVDKITEHEPQRHRHRGFAVYEKQIFCEKMIAACFLNTQQLGTWEKMLHQKTTGIKRFTEICTDNTQVHVSSSVNLNSWIPLHKRRAIEEENRRVDLVRRPDVEWQNFDIALSIPEPSYSDEQRWFRIDDYSASDINAWATTETFFCERCEQENRASVFCRDSTSFASGPQFPDRCMGCAYKNALYNSFYKIKDYREMRDSETYALACARYLYVQKFQEAKPGDDLLEYIKKCCPLVYMSVGKVVSSYGGLRCPIATSVAYASWGKARQLAWDRAQDAQNNLCFIAYYDAGNAAYAGFMKTLLTPQERERTIVQRCFHLYSAKESIKLVAARQPKKRKPPTGDERVEKDVEKIIAIIRDEPRFIAVPSAAIDRRLLGRVGMDEEQEHVDEVHYDFAQGVDAATLPQEDVRMDHEEPEGDADNVEDDALRIARARAWDATRVLMHGSFEVNTDNPQNLCVLCGSSDHGFRNCDSNSEMKRVIFQAFEAMSKAITSFPPVLSLQETTEGRTDREGQASAAAMDVDVESIDVESIASSSSRRPKAKAMPRRGAHGATQRHELQLSDHTRRVSDEEIHLCDGWVLPWAIRATSGHTMTPEITGVEIDPSKFAMSISNTLANAVQGRSLIFACGGIPTLLEAMRRCSASADELAAMNAQMREHLLKESALEMVINAMKNHVQHGRVQAALGAGQRVLQAMAQHTKDAALQCACCWALFCLSVRKPTLQQELARQGALRATLAAMKSQSSVAKVQEAGCWVLRELASTVQALSVAIHEHDVPEVQKAGSAARQRLAVRGFRLSQFQTQLVRPSIVKRRRHFASVCGREMHENVNDLTLLHSGVNAVSAACQRCGPMRSMHPDISEDNVNNHI